MTATTEATQPPTESGQDDETLQRYVERLRTLREMDRAILEAHSLPDIADAALQRIRQLVPCQRASVAVFDFDTNEAVLIAVHSDHETRAGAGTTLPLEPFGEIIDTIQRGEVYLAQEMPNLLEEPPIVQALRAEGFHAFATVPLIFHNELTGSLNLLASTRDAFTTEHIEIAREVANQLAIAIEHARLYQQVRAGRQRLQTLSRRLIEAQETERRHIARELHDEIGQALTAVKINLQAIQRLPDPSTLTAYLQESIEIVERALQQVRNLSLDLRPSLLDDLGLIAALRWYIDRQAQRAGFTARLTADPIETRLPADIETTCFRVAQQALTNIVRHAQARHVDVELRHSDAVLELIIRDDGVGFDVQAALDNAVKGASLGLLGMQERVLLIGGQIEIRSAPGQGTEIQARLPLTSKPLERRRRRRVLE